MIKIYYPRVKSLVGVCAFALSSFIITKTATAQTITTVSPNTGIPGSTVTITGTGFNATAASNAVYFGGVKATPTAGSTTTLAVTIPVGASNANVAVANLTTLGWVSYIAPFVPEYTSSCFISGAYNFKPKVDFTTGAEPFATGFVDLDGDGKLDMVVANHGTNNISYYRNTTTTPVTTPTYTAGTTFPVPNGPSSIRFADIDRDGKIDLVVACNKTSGMTVIRNTSTVGTISFATRRDLLFNFGVSATGALPYEVTIADFDGDGKPDIAAVIREVVAASGATTGNDSVKIYRNLIAGTVAAGFQAANFSPTPISFALIQNAIPCSISSTDFDGDGKADIVTGNVGAGSTPSCVSVLRNTSSGAGLFSFDTHVEFNLLAGQAAYQITTADLDADGKGDILVASSDGGDGYLQVFRNQATSGAINTGSFPTRIDLLTPHAYAVGLTTGDIDGDGKIDVAVSNFNLFSAVDAKVSIFRNSSVSGSITLASTASYTTGTNPIGVSIADVDGDTKPDIITANSVSNTVSIFRNYPLPITAPITGPALICVPNVDTFKSTVTGGTWSVLNPLVATIDPITGAVTPLLAGNDTVYYRIICNGDTATLLRKFFAVGTFPVVTPISGTGFTVCTGNTLSLSNSTPSGVWGSSAPAIATVIGGMVTGIAVSTPPGITITYSVTNACGASVASYGPITVNQGPAAITGTTTLCAGSTTTLSNTTPFGTWSSNNLPVATITNPGGVVSAVSAGTATISYTMVGGCYDTAVVTVTSGPVIAPIAGPTNVCVGANITLTDATPSGTWSSGDLSRATVSTSGMVHGIAAGSVNITYTLTNGCGTSFQIYAVTVNAVPGVITGTFNVCPGSTVSLFNSVGGGTWVSTNTAAATVTSTGGVGGVAGGTSVISYTLTGNCYDTAIVNVYNAPAPILGGTQVCVGSQVTLTNASTPGTWSQVGGFVSIGATSGVVNGLTAGNATISFTQTSTGCSISLTPFTVNNVPSTILGGPTICRGATTSLSSSPAGGTWTSTPISVASIDPVTGYITGNALGIATVSYSIPSTGCAVGTTISVFPSPGPITGSSTVCLGGFTLLADTPSGGVWSSSNSVVAPVNALGIVSGATLGTTTITYAIAGSACIATHSITVTPPPAPISGISTICPNTSITLSNATPLGTWSSGNTAVATIDPTSGALTGRTGGTTFITYTLTATSCFVFSPITINPGPTVSGPTNVCQGFTAPLSVDSVFGYWSSSDTFLVKVDSVTGVIRGVVTGPSPSVNTAVITYTTAGYGCTDTILITSHPIIAPLVSINTSPTLTLVGSVATVCQNTLVTYTANSLNVGPTPTFQWRVNNIVAGTGLSFSYIPLNGDSISVVVTSSEMCPSPTTARSYVKMVVITRLTPSMNLATGIGDTTCLGNPVTLNPNTVNGGAAPTYNWTINGINVGPGSTFTYVPANNDFIRVVVHSNFICPLVDTAVDTLRLTVSPYLNPTITIVGSDTACEGYPIAYSTIMTGGGTNPTYQWRVNGFNAGTAGSLAYMANTGDVVDVTMTSNFPCVNYSVTTSAPRSVTVIPVAIPDLSITVSPGYILAPGMTATFTAIPVNPGANPTYRWKKNGILIPGANTTVYSTNILATGDSFTCIMTNTDLCNNTSVFASQEVSIGGNVGVSQVNAHGSEIRVVPNPTKGRFAIRGSIGITTDEEVTVEITNMIGQVVYRGKFNAFMGTLDNTVLLDNELANGMYILNVHSEHLSKAIHFELGK